MEYKEKLTVIIEELLKKIPATFETIIVLEKEHHIRVEVTTKEPHFLIGKEGVILYALNHLVRRFFDKDGAEGRNIVLDINGYRKEQEERMLQEVSVLGEHTLLTKEEVSCRPMGPYERLLVHSFFAEHPKIKTESCGEGLLRHVVLHYSEKKQEKETNQ